MTKLFFSGFNQHKDVSNVRKTKIDVITVSQMFFGICCLDNQSCHLLNPQGAIDHNVIKCSTSLFRQVDVQFHI